jgi:hypothetical protein
LTRSQRWPSRSRSSVYRTLLITQLYEVCGHYCLGSALETGVPIAEEAGV